ncbi:MAG: MFS transporter [Alphaproteobacteria bacterium]|nr:MFS transporter [Alphaproteobacteria bacterium]
MTTRSQRLSLIFSCLGHTYIHFFTAFYFVIVLALEGEWGLPYHELIELWTLGALLVGLGALPAGWLGDRWSAVGMMVLFFLGMGVASIWCAMSGTPGGLLIGLAGIGLFASIYHPVGIAWLVRNSDASRGKLLGINGIFGSIGVAAAGAVAGGLVDVAGWRAAFWVPGLVCAASGLALLYCVARGWVRDGAGTAPEQAPQTASDMMRVFAILLLTMFLAAIIYQATQTALPKVFALRLGSLAGEGVLGIGAMVALVYGVAGVAQVAGGHLADKYPLKPVYIGAYLLQAPLLLLAADVAGIPLVAAALLMVTFNVAALPAENMLLARYAPQKHHGLAFGAKFVLYFGSGPLAILLVARVAEATGGFFWLFAALAGVATLGGLAAVMLPKDRSRAMAASPAE